jgi:putative membrane protein
MLRKLIIASTVVLSGAAFAAPPTQFLREAIQGNYSEVTLGRVIQNRSSNPQVRHFGTMLVRDHSHGLAQAQAIAARLRLRIPATLTPQARRELVVVRHLNGRAFDREVRRYMIDDHQKDIAEFRAQVRSGDRATSGYAAATIPVMRRHLAMARSIRG